MAGCAVRGHINTAIRICEDRVNKDNVDLAISEFEDFCKMNRDEEFDKTKHLGEYTKMIYNIMLNIKLVSTKKSDKEQEDLINFKSSFLYSDASIFIIFIPISFIIYISTGVSL